MFSPRFLYCPFPRRFVAASTLAVVAFSGLGTPFTFAQEEAATPAPQTEPTGVLDALFINPALWETSGESFVKEHKPLGFRWDSNNKESAQTTRDGTTLFGLPVCQAIVRVSDGNIGNATALFYNRGDQEEIKKPAFDALIKKAADAISHTTQAKPTQRGRDASSAVKAYGLVWNTEDADYLLEYSFRKEDRNMGIAFRPEFVRLEISPKEKEKTIVERMLDKKGPFKPTEHISRDIASGDVELKGIPMVDQGDKGYCAVASAERVLRYYEIRIDANELAQLADSSPEAGTSMTALTESLKGLTARLKIRVRTLQELNQQEQTAVIDEYNRAAKRAKATMIPQWSHDTSLSDVYAAMDADLLRSVRGKSKGQMTRFERQVKTQIDKGLPVIWSVMFGVIPEGPKKQSVGGHARLITGYNEKTNEIIYSDSWGRGHESKRMPLLDAWCMTRMLTSIEPF